MLAERLKEIRSRKTEIRNILKEGKEADLESLEKELDAISVEEKSIEQRQLLLDKANSINSGEVEARSKGNLGEMINEAKNKDIDKEKRGKDLKEKRSVSVGSSNILLPKHQSDTINGTFNQVSSLVDRVKKVPLNGGESYSSAYEKTFKEGEYTNEGASASDTDTDFGYANIAKSKIVSYSEETEEVIKLPNVDYDTVVVGNVSKSLRKKLTKEILIGDGSTNHLVGIFSAKAEAIDPSTDLELSGIDEKTLDDIIFTYGGDEDVESESVLILNKSDLKAFATLRNTQGNKVYDVKSQGNTGTIDGIPYIINSACKAVSNANTAVGDYCMAYGALENYELAVFSDIEVSRSTDSKFKEGMIAHKGVIFAGGNVASQNGFIRVKKK